MSESPVRATFGWTPSATTFQMIGNLFEEEDLERAQAIRGGATFNVTFTNGITPEAYRILTGFSDPPELETLL